MGGWVAAGIQNLKTRHDQKNKYVVHLAALEAHKNWFWSGAQGWLGGSRLQKNGCPVTGHRLEKKVSSWSLILQKIKYTKYKIFPKMKSKLKIQTTILPKFEISPC